MKKLNAVIIAQIIDAHSRGYSLREIGNAVGVSYVTVKNVLNSNGISTSIAKKPTLTF